MIRKSFDNLGERGIADDFRLVHKMFEAQAVKTPEKIAVVFENESLTYRELNERSNQLSHYLLSRGDVTNPKVCVLLEPSVFVSVALLGILKSGGVYIPLGQGFPRDYLTNLIDDINPEIILTTQSLRDEIPDTDAEVLCLDADHKKLADLSKLDPEFEFDPSSPAHIFYTSGTTGKPKGVVSTYRNLAFYVGSAVERYGFDSSMVIPSFARFTFSISFFEILTPLAVGGTSVFLPRETILDFEQLSRLLEQFTTIHASPSLFRKLLAYIEDEEIEPSRYSGLNHVSTGGDLVPPDVLERMKKIFRNAEVYVIYGCTEVCCMACTNFVSRDEEVTKTFVGKPFPGVDILVLDQDQQPVSSGVAGEVFIASPGLTNGYLNKPDLTNERYLIIDGRRFYRTGDRGRLGINGDLEILGRVDFQIKLRGIRIEPTEIEAYLRKVPGIRDGVVALRELRDGDEGLVAFIVPDPHIPVHIADIRRILQAKLPDYMVPSAFMTLEALPVNMNLKVDRLSLPKVDHSSLYQDDHYVAPETPTEVEVARIWCEVLGLERVGIKSDFFELGGHSLVAAQVVSRIRKRFQVKISISSIFEHLTVEALATFVAELPQLSSADERENLIKRVGGNDDLPLSFAQESMWFVNELGGQLGAYNIPITTEFDGPLNENVLFEAIETIADRHEALRTSVQINDGKLTQVVLPKIDLDVQTVDLQLLADDERRAELDRIVAKEARRPFDLSQAPLFRVILVRLAIEKSVLLLNFHHIVFDGWSIELFAREVSELYETLQDGNDIALEPLAVQYPDYSLWQRNIHSNDSGNEQLRYWIRHLQGAPSTLDLPYDHQRPQSPLSGGGTEAFVLSEEQARKLRMISRKSGSTLFMTLLAAYSTLLSKFSGQDDLVIGCPMANRNRSEIEPVIGFFVNTLPIRIDMKGDPSFNGLLQQIRKVSVDAFAHQEVPLQKIVEALNPDRSINTSPLFQVMLVLQDEPMIELKLPGISSKSEIVDRGASMFDLTLWVTETESGLVVSFEYNKDLFEPSTVRRIAEHFESVIDRVLTDPDMPLSSIAQLPDGERQKLLHGWNDTNSDRSFAGCIHQLFSEQAERTPDADAIVFGDERITYRELNQRANQLAHYLRAQGVVAESLIGICLERSIEMIVGVLGILKAGGGYVPLDPKYPLERLLYILMDSGAKVVVTNSTSAGVIGDYKGTAVSLDIDAEKIALQSHANPVNFSSPENLAYVIYTSGSTGRPKGVAIEHRSTVAFINWALSVFTPEQLNGVLLSTSICFDLSIYEMFSPLCSGGKIILVENILHLPASPAAEEVTLINTVPSAIDELIRAGRIPDSVRTVNLAGEPLKTSLVKQIYGAASVKEVFDLYGPTEDTTYSTFTLRGLGPATIGRPIADTRAYILDRNLQPVPVGVSGELYLGGAGLARCYLNRPELTAERFIRNPFSDDENARLYRTGDLARYRPTGEIEYLGRIDNQVKIRGFRIELGEIETVISLFKDVRESVVVAREDEAGDKRLVAYVVSASHSKIEPADLRSYLRNKLPEYMVPSAYVQLEQIPLTPNGKTDRKALPAPEREIGGDRSGIQSPQTDTERSLAAIWTEVLGVDNIGIHDSFFDLGGHSLLAIKMFTKVEETFRRSIPLASLFDAGTIEKLAEIVDREDWEAPESSLVPIQPSGENPPLFCVHAKGGNVLFYRDLAKYLGDEQPVYGLQARRLGGRQVAHDTLDEMADFYLAEMKALQPAGPYYVSGSSFGGLVALEIARKLEQSGDRVGLLALLDTASPYYPKLLKETKGLRRKYYRFVWRFQHHRESLAGLNGRERSAYVAEKIGKIGRKYRRKIQGTYRNAVKMFYTRFSESGQLPAKYLQVEDKILKAYQRYKPAPYLGKATLFRAEKQPLGIVPDPTLGWDGILIDMEILEVPGHHGSVVSEPYVRHLAEKLRRTIENAILENKPQITVDEVIKDLHPYSPSAELAVAEESLRSS